MREYVSEYTFRNRFLQNDTYKHNFTYEGLAALFDYLEALEDDTGEQIEFDMIGICCEFSEFEDMEDFNQQYSHDKDGYYMDDIKDETIVIEIPETKRFIIQDF